MPLPARTAPTSESNVAGGHTRMLQPTSPSAAATSSLSAWASSAPSLRRPFIFQLPATSCVPIAMLRPRWPVPIMLLTRSHQRPGGSTGLERQKEAGRLHAASDPLESGILCRQGALRAADPDLRYLGHRRHFSQPR